MSENWYDMYTCNNIVLQFLVLLASLSAVLSSPFRHGYHHGPIIAYAHPKCTKTLEKVTKEKAPPILGPQAGP